VGLLLLILLLLLLTLQPYILLHYIITGSFIFDMLDPVSQFYLH
jgi:hypothetical protein